MINILANHQTYYFTV